MDGGPQPSKEPTPERTHRSTLEPASSPEPRNCGSGPQNPHAARARARCGERGAMRERRVSAASASVRRWSAQSAGMRAPRRSSASLPFGKRRWCSSRSFRASRGCAARSAAVARERSATSSARESRGVEVDECAFLRPSGSRGAGALSGSSGVLSFFDSVGAGGAESTGIGAASARWTSGAGFRSAKNRVTAATPTPTASAEIFHAEC